MGLFRKIISFIGFVSQNHKWSDYTPLWFTSILRNTHLVQPRTTKQPFYRVQVYSVMVGYVIYSQRLNKSDELVTNQVTNEVTPLWLFL